MDQPNDHNPYTRGDASTARDARTNLLLAEILEELRLQNATPKFVRLNDKLPELSSDTPEPLAGMTHYSFITPPRRPFLSRMLCDLAANSAGRHAATSSLSGVTCYRCLDIGPEAVTELLAMPDAVLVSLGAWGPAGTSTDEVAR